HADIERHKIERQRDRLADAERGIGGSRNDAKQHRRGKHGGRERRAPTQILLHDLSSLLPASNAAHFAAPGRYFSVMTLARSGLVGSVPSSTKDSASVSSAFGLNLPSVEKVGMMSS